MDSPFWSQLCIVDKTVCRCPNFSARIRHTHSERDLLTFGWRHAAGCCSLAAPRRCVDPGGPGRAGQGAAEESLGTRTTTAARRGAFPICMQGVHAALGMRSPGPTLPYTPFPLPCPAFVAGMIATVINKASPPRAFRRGTSGRRSSSRGTPRNGAADGVTENQKVRLQYYRSRGNFIVRPKDGNGSQALKRHDTEARA